MKRFILSGVLFFAAITVLFFAGVTFFAAEPVEMSNPIPDSKKKIEQGLHKDALDVLRPWVLDPKNADLADKNLIPQAVNLVVDSLKHLNRVAEIDEFLETVANMHQSNWRVLTCVAAIYHKLLPHHGVIIDGKFQRGELPDNGQWVFDIQRDRVQALQLFVEAMPLVVKETEKHPVAQYFQSLADVFLDRAAVWKLQTLTNLTVLPDYESQRYWGGNQSKAPVGIEGNPIYYSVPDSFELAKNDGERWRWCLEQVVKQDPNLRSEVTLQLADFFHSQFGVETLQSFDFFRNKKNDPEKTASILNLETLADDETIAQLASGIKRFKLPDEFNFIALYQKVMQSDDEPSSRSAVRSLAEIYKNRLQLSKAAEYYQILIKKTSLPNVEIYAEQQLDQILKNWGRFDPAGSNVAGLNAELRYVFRNGKKVNLTAHEINIEKLLADIKSYLQSKPQRLDWNQIQIERIGQQLIFGNGDKMKASEIREKYLGKEIAKWSVELKPAEKHFDSTTTITFPPANHPGAYTPGSYLIRAEMEDGNVESVVVWLDDTVIVKKILENAVLYFVADSETGQPIASADVEFFGYKMEYKSVPGAYNRSRQDQTPTWTFNNFTQKTDNDGFVLIEPKDHANNFNNFNYLITARVSKTSGQEKSRFARLGFSGLWFGNRYDAEYNEVKAFVITDRPVYRPKDKVQIKAWIGTAKYDKPNVNEWAGKEIKYEIYDPRGEKIVEKANVKLDEYGGFVTEYELPKDATLGVYQFSTNFGGGNFRVEEYKKPEYEVTVDAPKEPVSLGDKITATIKAKYYFGSPVTEATVKYKVLREKANSDWYPIRPWDWFYGNGYAWFAYDAGWLDGWTRWGCCRPIPFWFPRYSGPPEVVAEQEVKISAEGTVDVIIDTSIAKEMFPDDDQRYSITAEVVDNSRRTIVGSGSVLVAKEPFKIYSWTDRGYYTLDQKIAASFQTRRLDGKPVSGDAEVKLYKITYSPQEAGTFVPVETQVHNDKIKFNDDGVAQISLKAAEPGQYRISCTLNGQEGGYVFNVYSLQNPGTAGVPHISGSFKYNDLELIPDKAEFAPGENVALRINTERDNSFVLLFVKPANGIAAFHGDLRPRLLRMDGKSQEIKIPVELRDMPNFYVEALTVFDGKVINEMKEIVVPPQQKVLNVEVKPSSETYKPGGKAKAELIVTDMGGKPVAGQIVVSIYDKSVEYISGGSNVGDIKEFFWKWRRQHHPNSESNLVQYIQNMPDPDKPGMLCLGLFGDIVVQNLSVNGLSLGRGGMGRGSMAKSTAVMAEGAIEMESAVPAAAPVAGKSFDFYLGFSRGGPVNDAAGSGHADYSEILDLIEEVDDAAAEPTIRKNFADTALWVGALTTDANGVAQIELDMPESLTTWKINVWTMAPGTRVGSGSAEVITRKDLILRMQTPRFLIEKDKVVLSANVHNYLATEKKVKVELEVAGDELRVVSEETTESNEKNSNQTLATSHSSLTTIPSNGEARVDWLVEAKSVGNAVIRMKAITDEESDAVEKMLPVYVHGMLKQDSFPAYLSPEKESTAIEINVPAERKPEQTKLTVRFSPTLAASMIDALPYLVDYPYGCTEQTLNRFLPTVIVKKVLVDMKVDLAKLKDLKTTLNAQELGENRKPGIAKVLKKRNENPVYDSEQVTEMVRDGVTKLTNMQNADGGWGWFGGYGEHSSAHLTALVVHGLQLSQQNDVAVDQNVLGRGVTWLQNYQTEQVKLLEIGELSEEQRKDKHYRTQADETDAFTAMVLGEAFAELLKTARIKELPNPMLDKYLKRDIGKLSPYGVSMYGIAASLYRRPNVPQECVKVIGQYLVQDDENQTAYLNLNNYNGWCWWAWHGSEFETQAYYLKLLMRTNPKSPVAPRLVKYLLNNRRHATYWNSTRDTAICIEAFAEFLKATGEDKPNITVDVLFDGEVKKSVEFTPENFLTADNTLVLQKEEVSTGKHKIELRKRGKNPLYINAYLENFTLEDPIKKTGLEVKIERKIYKLVRDTEAKTQVAGGRGQVIDQKVEKYKRVAGEECQVVSGDLIEVELIIDSKNDYESLLIEDMKPAGFEPVDVRSGYNGNALNAYVEFRDERVAFFVYRLSRGKHSVTYRLRAEQPGEFSALPAKIKAMYAPELKGNSDENKVNIVNSEELRVK